MSDKKLEAMLAVANTLTADDLDCLRGTAAVATIEPPAEENEVAAPTAPEDASATGVDEDNETDDGSPTAPAPPALPTAGRRAAPTPAPATSAGEYERQRTRESKVSTTCLGKQRQPHEWWPVGTELIGKIGTEIFTGLVVKNPAVKSGRSIRITSGAANGIACITPTRAAIEATEAYRQAHNLGRGGGITNGWDFWQPKA